MTAIKFQDVPTDTITDILVKDQNIYVSSWDCNVYVYDFHSQSLLYKIKNTLPILKMIWKNDLIFADSGGFMNFTNSNRKDFKKINFNFNGISTIELCNNSLFIGGFNKKGCIFHDNGICDIIDLKDKVYSSVLLNFGDKVGFYDIRNFKSYKEIQNKKLIRSMCIKSDKLYIGDIEGKLKIYNLLTNEDIILNAHYEILDNVKRVYPINCIIYDEYLYTCGSDGIVNRWKEEDKIKSRNVFRNNLGILKMASYCGRLVLCSGYNYEMGPADTTENSIFMI